jgi:hypothetical protein
MDTNMLVSIPGDINFRLRYSTDPDLHLNEFATREDVRRVRHLIPSVKGIGPVKLKIIDEWLAEGTSAIAAAMALTRSAHGSRRPAQAPSRLIRLESRKKDVITLSYTDPPRQLTTQRLSPAVMEAMRAVKSRDGISYSEQLDWALREWLGLGQDVRRTASARDKSHALRKAPTLRQGRLDGFL